MLHALVINGALGLLFSGLFIGFGPAIYRGLGGEGASLDAALAYSDVVFAGAVLVWLYNAFASVLRGTGNMMLPSLAVVLGVALLIPLSPLLIFGWGPVPAFGIAGGAMAFLVYYAGGTLALALYLRSPRSLLKPRLHGAGWRWPLFRDILRVGLVATVSALATNLTIGIATAQVGQFGPAAIAG